MKEKLLLVGSGPMAIEYGKVLRAQQIDFVVVGRGESSARNFKNILQTDVITGGIERWLDSEQQLPMTAIVAVGEAQLGKAVLLLLNHGFRRILVEKPGAFIYSELDLIEKAAKEKQAQIFIGYNRRFYSSVFEAQKIVKSDGGITSFLFEFTEWSHRIKDLKKEPGVLENWYFHNSTHVIDLAFYLGGKPLQIECHTAGGLPWHPGCSIFAGSGKTENGSLFTYHADWEAPGRWGLELCTKKHRLIFKPLESLQILEIGSIASQPVEINDKVDKEFKPGLYRQVEDFFTGTAGRLCTLEEHLMNVPFYKRIEGVV